MSGTTSLRGSEGPARCGLMSTSQHAQASLPPKLDRNGTSRATLATDRILILVPAGLPIGTGQIYLFTNERMKSYEEISACSARM